MLSDHDETAVRAALDERRSEAARRLASLTGRFDEVVQAAAGSNVDDEHDPEGATIAFERSQIGALVHQATTELEEVAAARERLDAGAYGLCERCGTSIPAERLRARPTARTCVGCAT
ncbi:TraR/DksA family transcriptional regulator [Cellulomonas carbonis]|uniref:TraR/DksA family transcriptional regulator n=1 Tax=Cellulomonas carbonis T26 TaxID=947969 RepID=A0A0A0BTT9_9CELL|nr:TraR/DksA C4-type zinc finger protein [Cellulomonas carbonis]KGM11370.1 TraR/DksA family transcriptional regulator [Cellulomonas carbonis T26]GGC00622.1 DnaK suppressor protein [Cellulomonas carbonis]